MLDSERERPRKTQKIVSEDRISSLPDDLLLQILARIPTKTAASTMVLSKRWRFVWTMLPILSYRDTKNRDEESWTMLPRHFDEEERWWRGRYLDKEESKKVCWFLSESMRLHNTPVLKSLHIQLGPHCPVDFDVVKWIAKALDGSLCHLFFKLLWKSERIRMPSSLYTCKTLATLTLAHKIVVDVPSSVSLPSLTQLVLFYVVYKDEDSHVRLLSSCPILKSLHVERRRELDDNVRKFSVKVPSLKKLTYINKMNRKREEEDDGDKSLVINTPALEYLYIDDIEGRSGLIEYMPHLVEAHISVVFNPNDNFLRSLSPINCMSLTLEKTMLPWSTVNYSQLRECTIDLCDPFYESLGVLLSNCPKLQTFIVRSYVWPWDPSHQPSSWNQPSCLPKCMLCTLNIFKWKGYFGKEDEKGLVSYIIGNSRCLTTVEVTADSTIDSEEQTRIIADLDIHD